MMANQGERKIQKWKPDDKQTLGWVTGGSTPWSGQRVDVSMPRPHPPHAALIAWTLSGVITISTLLRHVSIGRLMMSGEDAVFIHGWSWAVVRLQPGGKDAGPEGRSPSRRALDEREPAVTQLIISIVTNPSISLVYPRWPHAFISS